MASPFHHLLILFFFTVNRVVVLGSIILEDGYIVSTILDGNKLGINPHLILPQFGSSDLILLDSSDSTFYTISFTSPNESLIKKLAGNGAKGYDDGELGSAMFSKPNNFAVDVRGNVYVADVHNLKIRKISKSGVTTIAGGYSQKPGKSDGLAQNSTFSDDFDLTFIPERCALMISDHGNKLIRQINLKAEDCAHSSHSGLVMSAAWAVGLGLFCLLLGLVVGFVSRPYVISSVSISCIFVIFMISGLLIHHHTELCRQGGMRLLPCKGTWNHCLMSLVRQVLMFCFDIRSAAVSLPLYMLLKRLILLGLSTISLMFRTKKIEFKTSRKKPSLLDFDNSGSSKRAKVEPLKDLISFDEGVESLGTNFNSEPKDGAEGSTDVSSTSCCTSKIDKMVQANIIGFSEQVRSATPMESLEYNIGLVKRKVQ